MTYHNLNFIPQKSNLRLLQTGALVAVVGCIAMLSAVLFGTGGRGPKTAAIADSLNSPASSSSAAIERALAKPKAISENPTTSAALGTSPDTVRYYEATTGKAFLVNLQTLRTDVLSDQRLSGFLRSWWAPRVDRVVSSFQLSDGVAYRSYDYGTKETSTIGKAVASIAISPDGRDVAYLENGGDALSLTVANLDGSSPRVLLQTRTQETQLTWPSKNFLSLSSRRSDRPGFDISTIDLEGALLPVLTNLENLEYAWSPDASRLLYSYFAPASGIMLWLHDMRSGTDTSLGLATSAQKCAWSPDGESVICGVPAKSSLTRDVPADHSATIDDIVRLSLVTGSHHRLYGGVNSVLIGVIEPLVSTSGKYFVFTNVFDQRLYLLPL